MKVFASWSGGKESCLACYKAISEGFEISYLVNMVTLDELRSMTHGIDSHALCMQSTCLGVPIIQKRTTWNEYENDFKEVVKELKLQGVEAGVFGDIDIQEHRDWVERVCKESGIMAIEPLWDTERKRVLEDFINAGFKAIVVCARADLPGKEILGLYVDEQLLKYLAKFNIDMCGEGGEYHTFVFDGPLFNKSIEIITDRKILKDGYWFLNIEDCKIIEKEVEI
ncbi:MAG: diphthine--ammonia ligase [Theionarchaea archaeon]|nr:diphthine--ammonia ligase [Theionarchaea archaeon]